jgi:glycolate oxidase iron-sulfur subunit
VQTSFTLAQLADPDIEVANAILRTCVHCGFCTATCPTYVLLGDERDSPRGRIYLIKGMLEADGPPAPEIVTHIDRCLSCLSCMTTCPASVDYMHLVDHARRLVDEGASRPVSDRALRRLLALVLPRPGLFRLALVGAWLARPFAAFLPGRLKGLVALAPASLPRPSPLDGARVFPAQGERRRRVALLAGCAQRVLDPGINDATVRLLTRLGCEVVIAKGVGCCAALPHHMGRHGDTLPLVRANVAAWCAERDGDGVDAVLINTSGCGTTVKDYGFLLRDEPDWAARAAWVSENAKDVSEFLAEFGLDSARAPKPLKVAYHAACSLQHGQKITAAPKALLAGAGFEVLEVAESHLCCGSAGTYNLLQPELSAQLRSRKVAHIESTGADIVAAGNLGCMVQIGAGTGLPVVHTIELLDWATGGPAPNGL